MGRWSTALFADDVALDVKREYGALLSVGKSSNEAEEMLTSTTKIFWDVMIGTSLFFGFHWHTLNGKKAD